MIFLRQDDCQLLLQHGNVGNFPADAYRRLCNRKTILESEAHAANSKLASKRSPEAGLQKTICSNSLITDHDVVPFVVFVRGL